MSKRDKQGLDDNMPSKLKLVSPSTRRLTTLPHVESRKKLLSRPSMIGGSFGSKMFVYRRGDRLKIPRYQNTYRLESFRGFLVGEVDKIVFETLEAKLNDVMTYNPTQCSIMCQEIVTEVQKKISKKDYDRYKIVAQASIVQRFHQSFHTAFQCLWDLERDNYSYHVFENNYIHAWCIVFGLYYE